MQESYREGLANRSGPEPCEGSRKVALEALDRGIRRLGIELRKDLVRVANGVGVPEGNTAAHASASAQWTRGVGDPRHAEKLQVREPGDPIVARQAVGRVGGRTR
jgi:hypothetical protein